MRPFAFYQQRLDDVSRSFALCIPQLAPPFREQVALSYLLLRVLDTVEDAPFTDKAEQARQFDRLVALMRADAPPAAEIERFVAAFPAGLTPAERALVGDTAALLEDAGELPVRARAVVVSAVERMAAGMAAYARRSTVLRLIDLEDVSRYCCFVAGLVGELLTRLWSLGHLEPPPAMALAYHFGLFLQKVNILKDQGEDEASQRFFVPDRTQLLASLRIHAARALDYLQALPRNDRGYRIFCAWSLMMGASTIAQLDGRPQSRREETAKLLARTADIAQDNAALRDLFADLMPPLPDLVLAVGLPKPESAEWFLATLAAPLTSDDVGGLGVGERPSRRIQSPKAS